MKYTEHSLNILTAIEFNGIGNAWVIRNLSHCPPYEEIVALLNNKLPKKEQVTNEIFISVRKQIEQKFIEIENYCDGVTAVGEPDFPLIRGNVPDSDKPVVLFYKGDLSLLSKKNSNVAVIGLLNPDDHTCDDERKVVQKLVEKNAVIVSGLAMGCDAVAHKQALLSSGATVAILPSPLTDILPASNRDLAEEIASNDGLLITEYYEPPKNHNDLISRFIKRDRLQALFSDAVILSASYTPESIDKKSRKIDSGSRHALEKARQYGILRAAIYDENNKENPKYDLNRELIKDKTTLVINPHQPEDAINQILQEVEKTTTSSSSQDIQSSLF